MPPLAHLGFVLDENLTNQALERLCQRCVRDIALVLVELAGREESARWNKHLLQLVYHCGFADARITGYEHELWRTLRHDTVEGCEQYVDFALSPVQFLRDQQSVRGVVLGQKEWIDPTVRLPFRQAPPKIGFEAGGGLVALLRVLGEELHDDGRQPLGGRGPISKRWRPARHVALRPPQRGRARRQ